MRFLSLTMQNFRSASLAEIAFPKGKASFFCGPNGQGKTNLLEALGFVTALRSFRTTERSALIRWGQREAALRFAIAHERLGETTITIRINSSGLDIQLDGERLTRYGDLIGRFPTVVLSSQDIQLLRGAPQLRRRFLDMALSGIDADYYIALKRYHQALRHRNKLLKDGSDAELAAFSHPMAQDAALLTRKRATALSTLGSYLVPAYARIADCDEAPAILYQTDLPDADPALFLQKWADQLPRDRLLASTQFGPHRDDFELSLFNRPAREFGSEGQQRALILALRLAQASWSENASTVKPVLLADDVLSELDPARRQRFWAALAPQAQLIATGTIPPDSTPFALWQVMNQHYHPVTE